MIDAANEALRAKGYSQAQLAAVRAPLPGKALLKGSKIVSPFADAEETVAYVADKCVPPAEALGRRTLTPHELRACLDRAGE